MRQSRAPYAWRATGQREMVVGGVVAEGSLDAMEIGEWFLVDGDLEAS